MNVGAPTILLYVPLNILAALYKTIRGTSNALRVERKRKPFAKMVVEMQAHHEKKLAKKKNCKLLEKTKEKKNGTSKTTVQLKQELPL